MKKEEKKKMMQQLGIESRRGDTFVGFRPTYFRDKSKYNRKAEKSRLRKEVYA
jgi:hypothetical protein